jgi:Icc-related predicted phosphoesterase
MLDYMNTSITFISDTHSKHAYCTPDLPGGDILIHSGDMSSMGYEHELYAFLKWFSKQKYEHKVFIAGNHDWIFERNPVRAQEILSDFADVIYLQDSSVELMGLKIYGSPWQPAFHDWAFNLPRNGEELRQKWDAIPEGTDILITHGPPHQVLDYVIWSQSSAGCERLQSRVFELQPLIHAFGHIHSAGMKVLPSITKTLFINASVVDERYDYAYKPITVQMDPQKKIIYEDS